MKKFLAILVSVMLVLSLSVFAFAEGGDTPATPATPSASITINPATGYTPDTNTTAETYHYYKIFDAVVPSGAEITDSNVGEEVDGTATGYTYTIANNSDWYAAVAATNYFDFSDQGDGTSIVTLKEAYMPADGDTAAAIAALLAPSTVDKSGSINYDGSLTLGTAQAVDPGYYLIISSLGEKLILATTDVEITEKNTYPTVDKTEEDADDDAAVGVGLGTAGMCDVAVGDTITYHVSVAVPATANQPITVTDTMSEGLTFDYAATTPITANIPATTTTGEEPDTVTTTNWAITDSDESGWTIEVYPTDATKGQTITFTFEATVNADAITDSDKENEAEITYSNFSQTDTVNYELATTGIHKFDGNTNADLEGVVFDLQLADGTSIPVIQHADGYYYPCAVADGGAIESIETDADGLVVIRGLDNDQTYQLVEITPPEGYNGLEDPVELTLTIDANGTQTPTYTEVENNKGSELPSTGGIGTTIFYIVGAILVLGAAIILIAKRRTAAAEA